jgi:hypothetical protein
MLGTIGSIIALVCGIMVLVKLFQQEGALKGILYTYIWGWQNIKKEELQLKNWMYVWTAAIILGIILNIVSQVISQTFQGIESAIGG